MLPAAARPTAVILRFAPQPAAPAARLAPQCYLPKPADHRAHAAELLLRRWVLTLAELGCIGLLLAAVGIWAALAAGA